MCGRLYVPYPCSQRRHIVLCIVDLGSCKWVLGGSCETKACSRSTRSLEIKRQYIYLLSCSFSVCINYSVWRSAVSAANSLRIAKTNVLTTEIQLFSEHFFSSLPSFALALLYQNRKLHTSACIYVRGIVLCIFFCRLYIFDFHFYAILFGFQFFYFKKANKSTKSVILNQPLTMRKKEQCRLLTKVLSIAISYCRLSVCSVQRIK